MLGEHRLASGILTAVCAEKVPTTPGPVPAVIRPAKLPVNLQHLPPGQLLFDPRNPRLAGHHYTIEEQDQILEWLWKNKSVDELVDSILASGFWAHEELFAAEEGGKLVVVEGNRRLAAVKLLTDDSLRSRLRIRDLGMMTPEVRESLRELPVFLCAREEIWEFIGFKHVNGPQEWDSIAKAKYVHRVRQEFGVDLDVIARTIGDRHDTVARLYSGYLVLRQAQSKNLFDPEDCKQRKFPFSHLWTALGYTSIRSFLGVDSERLLQPNPVPSQNLQDLGILMQWLFGSKQKDLEPKVKRQNPDLRDLAKALENPKGIVVLRADLPLEAAKEASLGDERLFQDALVEAEAHLRNAKRYVATGYGGEEHSLQTAGNIETLAKSLRREMSEIRSSQNSEDF